MHPFAYFVGSKRYHDTRAVAERLRQTGERFDPSWRHADANGSDMTEAAKAAFYEQCCTFAANDIADNPALWADHWKGYL
jgi:hypothetical protein